MAFNKLLSRITTTLYKAAPSPRPHPTITHHPVPLPLPCHRHRPLSTSSPTLSHIGSSPIHIPPSVSLLLNPDPWSPQPTRFTSITLNHRRTIPLTVRGPLGQMTVNLHPFIKIQVPGITGPTKNVPDMIDFLKQQQQQHVIRESDLNTKQEENENISSHSLIMVQLPTNQQQQQQQQQQEGEAKAEGQPLHLQLSLSVENENVKHQRAIWGLTRALIYNAMKGVTEGFTTHIKMVGVGYKGSLEDCPITPLMTLNTLPPSPPSPSSLASPIQRLRLKLGYSNDILINLPLTSTFLNATFVSPTELLLKGLDKREVNQLAASIRNYRKPEPYNGKGIFVNGETIRRKEVKKK